MAESILRIIGWYIFRIQGTVEQRENLYKIIHILIVI